MTDTEGTRERLAREDVTYRRLARKHEEYEQRLADLQVRKFLTEDEQVEEVNLKKLKLRIKDQMEDLVRQSAGADSSSRAR